MAVAWLATLIIVSLQLPSPPYKTVSHIISLIMNSLNQIFQEQKFCETFHPPLAKSKITSPYTNSCRGKADSITNK